MEMLKIGKKEFTSRLIVGTGKYANFHIMKEALIESGTEIVTVAVRRVNLDDRSKESMLDYIDRDRFIILPNTAGCFNRDDAIRAARLGRDMGLSEMVKLEVIGDAKTLMPDTEALLEAARVLVKEGFIVLPYTNDDVVVAKKLEDAGVSCVMPLAAPIGSGQGILNSLNIKLILETVKIPVIVDAGVGTASDAAIAMEMGVDGVLMNTGIACSKDPVKMAKAMKMAVASGRLAYEAGRISKKMYAQASSPDEGVIE